MIIRLRERFGIIGKRLQVVRYPLKSISLLSSSFGWYAQDEISGGNKYDRFSSFYFRFGLSINFSILPGLGRVTIRAKSG
jgi:hypothetical protein